MTDATTPILTPAEYVRRFATGWAARDASAIGTLCAEDAEMLTLTGAWCEGRPQIEATLDSEFVGLFSHSKLVTGKAKLRMLTRSACVIHQRYVISSLRDAQGHDMGRVSAILMSVLAARPDGWHAVALQFSAVEQ